MAGRRNDTPLLRATNSTYGSGAGALVMMGGGVFAARQINVSVNPNSTVTRTTNIKTALLPDNNLALAGHYTAHFTGINSTLTFVTSDSDNDRQQCTSESQGVAPIAFTVQAAVLDSCQIQETSDLMLGSYSASQTNITDFNNKALSILCTNGSSYHIGLIPSNGNMHGAGVMKGVVDNRSEVAYQLHSTAGFGGAPWGDSADNWVTRRGNGSTQTETVYITVPNIDVKADKYTDVITVKIYY